MEQQQVEIIRFDRELMNVNEATALQDIRVLYEHYPLFMPRFVEDILGIPSSDTAYLVQALPQFLNDTVYGFRETNARVQQVFTSIDSIQREIEEAFTRICYLYPNTEVPLIYFIISGFNTSVYFVDDAIAVGADMYLGSDYEYYNRVVYDYQKQTMRKQCIPADVVSAWLFRNIPYTSKQNRLLDNMLYRGKIMYMLSLLLPEEPDYEIMGYTKEQWQWCEKNERAIWNFIMDKRDLFKSETLLLTSYLNDGPFTAEVSQNSPARLGTWLGWRIAESYMQHNENVTLQELMAEGDAQKILELSYYKP